MVAKRNARCKLTWRESDAKYIARGRVLSILLKQGMGGELEGNVERMDGAPEPPDYTAEFTVICRLLLDVGSKGAGRSYDPICGAGGPVPRFEIDSTFCSAPERTFILVCPP